MLCPHKGSSPLPSTSHPRTLLPRMNDEVMSVKCPALSEDAWQKTSLELIFNETLPASDLFFCRLMLPLRIRWWQIGPHINLPGTQCPALLCSPWVPSFYGWWGPLSQPSRTGLLHESLRLLDNEGQNTSSRWAKYMSEGSLPWGPISKQERTHDDFKGNYFSKSHILSQLIFLGPA